MSYFFTESPLPKDLIAKKLDELTKGSSDRVIFGYVQIDNEAKFNNSIKNCKISHEVYVRSSKNNKFKLPILRISHGIKPYPVSVGFVDEILKDITRKEKELEWRSISLDSEEAYKVFIDKIINDKDFFTILNSVYNM